MKFGQVGSAELWLTLGELHIKLKLQKLLTFHLEIYDYISDSDDCLNKLCLCAPGKLVHGRGLVGGQGKILE